MRVLYLLSVWLHILAAAVWVGGILFLVLVLVPAVRRPEFRQSAASLIQWTGLRFRWVGWIALGLLILSGSFNLAYRGVGLTTLLSAGFWEGRFGRTLGVKLFLVAAILLTSAVHDFWIGPQATRLWEEAPDSEAARRLRRRAASLGRLNLLLALTVMALGVMLVRG